MFEVAGTIKQVATRINVYFPSWIRVEKMHLSIKPGKFEEARFGLRLQLPPHETGEAAVDRLTESKRARALERDSTSTCAGWSTWSARSRWSAWSTRSSRSTWSARRGTRARTAICLTWHKSQLLQFFLIFSVNFALRFHPTTKELASLKKSCRAEERCREHDNGPETSDLNWHVNLVPR